MKSSTRLTFCVLLAACATSGPQPSRTVPSGSTDSSELVRAVHWMKNSAEYRAAFLQTYALAGEQLRRQVEDRDSGSWAVSIDADETLISNLEYERELVQAQRESTDELWADWVARRAAPPLPGAVAFLERVRELGGRIAVVTNRKQRDCPDTRANLEAFGLPFDLILCRTEDPEKESRWERIEKGTASPDLPPLEIVMWLGDNIRDFPDMNQDSRFSAPEAFSDYGTRFFVFPNPSYGSWVANPFD
jgi:5'-nucleotidase (lipoprotein e(P4) family)